MRFGLHRLALLSIFSLILLCACVREDNESAPVVNGWNEAKTRSPVYVVRSGDSLYSIAWAFGLDYRNLAETNHLEPPYHLIPGQHLNMVIARNPSPKSTSPITERAMQQHVVVAQNREPYRERFKPELNRPKAPAANPHFSPSIQRWIMPAWGRIIRNFSNLPWGNKGIDIHGNYGEKVVATAAGEVVYAGAGVRAYGNLVILKHNDNYLSAYGYNKNIVVKEGAWVRMGQTIGTMGRNDAGIVLLHFEIRRNGKPVNPLMYLNRK